MVNGVVDGFTVRGETVSGVYCPKPIARRERGLGTVGGYFRIKIICGSFRAAFGLKLKLGSLPVLKTDQPAVVVAIGFCGVPNFE